MEEERALRKLHNVVVAIRDTPQRVQAFNKYSKGRALIRDNDTRWDSWYYMLDRAFEPEMQEAISAFCSVHKSLAVAILAAEDWQYLGQISDFLRNFHEATIGTEGRLDTIDTVLPVFDFLLETFEEALMTYDKDPYTRASLKTGWAKLEKYYDKSDETAVYVASMILCPKWTWAYFEDHWPAHFVAAARKSVNKLWEAEYKPTSTTSSAVVSPKLKNSFTSWLDSK